MKMTSRSGSKIFFVGLKVCAHPLIKKAYTKGNEDFRKMLEGKAQIGFVLEKLNSQGSVRANKNHGDQTGPDICLLHEKRDDQLRQARLTKTIISVYDLGLQ